MRIWTAAEQFDGHASAVALGTFDGVHIGHQELIRKTKELAVKKDAMSVVCTFDVHPLSIICPERAPVRLMSLEEKIEKFAKLGVDGVLIQHFTFEYAAIAPDEYLRKLVDSMRVKVIVCGFNFTFGDRGRGNAQTILDGRTQYGYEAEIVPAVMDGEDTVSSSLIRELILNGDHERARRLLRIRRDV